MISYCRFITIFLFVFSFNSYAVDSNVCANGGDEFGTFKYAGFLTDENQNTVSGFQTVELQVSLFDSLESGQELYSQFLPNVEVSDGVFQIEIGPCIPAFVGDTFLQLHVNNQALSPRSKVLANALALQALNSQRFSGLTTSELFIQINDTIQQGISTFTQSSIDPEFGIVTQNIEAHKSQVNNPHSVTKDQIGLSAVDNIQQLPFTHLQLVLVPTSDVNVPSSKAVADYISSLLVPLNSSTLSLESRVSEIETSTASQVIDLESRISSIEASSSVDLPMSYLQTVLVTDSDVNVPTSSAVATYIDKQVFYTDAIPADQLDSVQVANLMSGALADGSTPWSNIPADQFSGTEVSNLQAGGLADGSTPWTANILPSGSSSEYLRGDKSLAGIPADQFSGGEVSNLQAGMLANGASPWETSEADLGVATSGQVLAGDRSWVQLNAAAVDLDQVQNINVLESFTQNGSAGIETSKIRANGSGGLALINQSNQGLFVSNSGYVGVNTNSPTSDLQVAGTAKILEIFANDITSKSMMLLNTAVAPLIVSTETNATPVLFVSNSGKVGVNTTNPIYELEIEGDFNVNGSVFINGSPFADVIDSGMNLGTALVGGQSNSSIATNAIVIGGVDNHVYGENSTVSGGQSNFVPGHYSSISGGVLNTAAGIASGILAGSDNETLGLASAVVGGEFNISAGNDAVIAGGADNTAFGEYSFIGGGVYNTVNATNSAIVGGNWMTINGDNVFGFNGSQYSVTVTSELTNAAIFYVDHFAIGNADPSEALDVAGRLRLRSSTDEFAYDGTLRWSGSDLELMKSGSWGPVGGGYAGIIEDANGVQVEIEGTTRFIVDSMGYVGVNTTAPQDNFHVVGNSFFEGYVEAQGIIVASESYADIELSSEMGSALRMNILTDEMASGAIEFSRFGSPEGSIRYNYSTPQDDPEMLFEVENSPRMIIRTNVVELMNGAGIKFSDGSLQFTGVHPDIVENGSGSTKVFTHDNGIDFNTNSVTQIRITSTGNLGIGEYNPMERLVVDGRIQLKTTTEPLGGDGVIRFDGNDFLAKRDGDWYSMTGKSVPQASSVSEVQVTTKPNLLEVLAFTSPVLFDNKLYVLGGYNVGGLSIPDVFIYDIQSESWSKGTSGSLSRHSGGAVVYDDRIFVVGGESGGRTDSVEIYDPEFDTWEVGPSLPNATNIGWAVELNQRIYIAGGRQASSTVTDAVLSIDPIEQEVWVEHTSMIEGVSYSTGLKHKGKLYVFGGRNNSNALVNNATSYDPNSDTWTSLAAMPQALEGLTSVSIGDYIYLIGGKASGGVVDNIFSYDPDSDTYELLTQSLTTPKSFFNAAGDGQKAYLVGGQNGGQLDEFHLFEAPFTYPETDAFTSGSDSNQANGFESAILGGNNNEISGDRAFIAAGTNNSINDMDSVVLAGSNNEVIGEASIVMGSNVTMEADHSFIFNGTPNSLVVSSHLPNSAFFMVDSFSIGEIDPDDTLEIHDNDSEAVVHVKGAGSAILKLDVESNGDFSKIYFTKFSGPEGSIVYDHASIFQDERLTLNVGGVNRFHFTGEGKLGIGSNHSNPTYMLDVLGDIKAENSIAITTDAGNALVGIDAGTSSNSSVVNFGFGGISKGKIEFAHNADAALGEMSLQVDSINALKIRTDKVILPANSGIAFDDGSILKSAKKVAFSVYSTTNQTILTGVTPVANFEAVAFDVTGDFDLSADKFVVPVSGIYDLRAKVKLQSPNSLMLYQIMITSNGSNIIDTRCITAGTTDQNCFTSGLVQLNSGDELRVTYHHNSGTNQTLEGNIKATNFNGFLIYKTP